MVSRTASLERQSDGKVAPPSQTHDLQGVSRTLADALRTDPWLTQAVRESRAFALDLASALFGISFVQVTRHGTVSKGVPPWRCTAFETVTLISEMRGLGENPRELLASLDRNLLLRNTATEIEDHINRIGWRVW
jgi:hypothetical protein